MYRTQSGACLTEKRVASTGGSPHSNPEDMVTSFSRVTSSQPRPVSTVLWPVRTSLTGVLTAFALGKDRTGDCMAPPSPALDAFLAADSNGLVTFAVMLEFSHDVHSFYFRTKEGDPDLAPRLTLPKATPRRP